MKISIDKENCTEENAYVIEESADSIITIQIEFPTVITSQSRKILIDQVNAGIQTELGKFKWIITGSLLVDFTWFLNDIERQETDKVGDIDNITKPLQDALCGPNGIMIDDSQIGGLYTHWMTRNEMVADNILVITIRFNNDYTLSKNDLVFIQYSGAMCMPITLDVSSLVHLIGMKMILKQRMKFRKLASRIKTMGATGDRHFLLSAYDFHRTRVGGFKVISLNEFNKTCSIAGLSFQKLISIFRSLKK